MSVALPQCVSYFSIGPLSSGVIPEEAHCVNQVDLVFPRCPLYVNCTLGYSTLGFDSLIKGTIVAINPAPVSSTYTIKFTDLPILRCCVGSSLTIQLDSDIVAVMYLSCGLYSANDIYALKSSTIPAYDSCNRLYYYQNGILWNT